MLLTVPALLLTSTRSAILGLIVASVYLLRGKYYKILGGIVPIAIIAIGIMTVTRPLDWSKPT
ncbi:O-antigen polymerase, partial [Microcoleus anatoxicus PTRS1]